MMSKDASRVALTLRRYSSKVRVLRPPASGVPVPGAKAGSSPSMSMLTKTLLNLERNSLNMHMAVAVPASHGEVTSPRLFERAHSSFVAALPPMWATAEESLFSIPPFRYHA